MTEYLVRWPTVWRSIATKSVEADSPEKAAEKAVSWYYGSQLDPRPDGVEVAVYEKKLTRHDVILDEVTDDD